jgi:uncharacterized SAM-binding protein YcdF (DUF218 family)
MQQRHIRLTWTIKVNLEAARFVHGAVEWHGRESLMTRFVSALLQPHNFLYLLLLAGVIGLWRIRPALPRRRLLAVTLPFVLISLVSMPVISYLGYGSLEWHYPPVMDRPTEADAIVVLSGYVRDPDEFWPSADLGSDTMYRCLRAAELYQQGPRCPMIVSGGRVERDRPGPTLSEAMRGFLVKHGVAAEDIVLEERSQTTYENALYTGEILRQQGITRPVLVTDANSMLRAELCFRKQGISVVPRGCDYRARQFEPGVLAFLPNPAGIGQLELIVHEWLGLAWYRLLGRI